MLNMTMHAQDWDQMIRSIRNFLPQGKSGEGRKEVNKAAGDDGAKQGLHWKPQKMSAIYFINTDASKYGAKELEWMHKSLEQGFGNSNLQNKIMGEMVRGMLDGAREAAGMESKHARMPHE